MQHIGFAYNSLLNTFNFADKGLGKWNELQDYPKLWLVCVGFGFGHDEFRRTVDQDVVLEAIG